jgi:PAS domain S-box-containing protein
MPVRRDMSSRDLGRSHWSIRYGTAAIFVVVALLLRQLPAAPAVPFMFFFAAVALSARVCGFGPAIFSIVLSAVAADFFLLPPRFSFLTGRDDLLRIMFFGIVAFTISNLAKKKSEAEKSADERRAQLAAVVESSEDAIFNKSLDGTILTWNRAAQQMYGYTPDEIIGKNVRILAPPEKSGEIDGILERLQSGERVAYFETERITKDGRLIYVSLSISPVHDEEGKIVEAATIARDVTERKQTETALRQSEERFRGAHAMANVSAFDWNVETGDVIWFSELPALRDLAPDGKFETWMKTIHPEDKPRFDAAIERMFREGNAEIEVRLVRPDGEIVWLSERGELYHNHTGKPHCLGVAMDVTRRKRTEEGLRQAEKLAAAGQLGATIAHELNNPLEAVTNLVYLMHKNKSLDDKARKQLEVLDQELARMAHMTRRTLGFYRDTSTAVLVVLGDLMDEVFSLYARKIESREIELQREYQTQAEVAVFPGEMRKVFSNLIANAIDAVGNRGRITARITNSRDWRNPSVRGVRVAVADSGTGISPADRRKIFEPFYTTKRETGTGLGLWLSKDIVESHGGNIAVRSHRNEHTCRTVFSVFIPIKEPLPLWKSAERPEFN